MRVEDLPVRLAAWRSLHWMMPGGVCVRRTFGHVECGGGVDAVKDWLSRQWAGDVGVGAIRLGL